MSADIYNHHTTANALQQAEQICKDRGIKLTDIRYTVLNLIWQSHKYPLKAYDILDKLKKYNSSAQPPTVYRALDFLLEHRFIHKLQSLNAYISCPHPLAHHTCYFLICSRCGKSEECCNTELKTAVANTTTKNNFTLKQAMVEIMGKCSACTT